ncbi:MAG: MlaE family lipid ABC transporter permease subunit [Planctomycetota bacterium]
MRPDPPYEAPALEHGGAEARVRLRGPLALVTAGALRRDLDRLEDEAAGRQAVVLDLAGVDGFDSAGIVVLLDFERRLTARGASVTLAGAEASLARTWDLYLSRRREPAPPPAPGPSGLLHRVGAATLDAAHAARAALVFIGGFTESLPRAVRRRRTVPWRDLPDLVQRVGGEGMGIVVLTNLLIGLITGFVGVLQLKRFGAQSFIAEMVAIGQLRELGPLITAIIVSGRTGAGYAAELGTMKVSEEVDALRSMGFDPMSFLVLPRMAALLLALPILTLLGDLVGVAGGMIASLPMLDMSVGSYLEATREAATPTHFFLGWIKAVPFAVAITWIACAQGLATRGGAEAVGHRTTRAVVFSIFAVIAIDSVHAMVYALLEV